VWVLFFFFNDTATTEIYTLSLHDALPIWRSRPGRSACRARGSAGRRSNRPRSEEHTSELQSLTNLVCRLILEKKQKQHPPFHPHNATHGPRRISHHQDPT